MLRIIRTKTLARLLADAATTARTEQAKDDNRRIQTLLAIDLRQQQEINRLQQREINRLQQREINRLRGRI